VAGASRLDDAAADDATLGLVAVPRDRNGR
jgi:hypothetical protein